MRTAIIGLTTLILAGCATQEEQLAEVDCPPGDKQCLEQRQRVSADEKWERRKHEMRINNQRQSKPDDE